MMILILSIEKVSVLYSNLKRVASVVDGCNASFGARVAKQIIFYFFLLHALGEVNFTNLLKFSEILAMNSRLFIQTRSYSYLKFKRVYKPPLQQPKESPYIVGPYLKPDYLPAEYLTEPIRPRHDDHLNYFIYEPTEVTVDDERTVKLLLIQDVEGLGVSGQVVDAPFRFSRLVAMKKAEYATDFAHKWYKFGPRTSESASTALSPRTVRLLGNQVFDLPIPKDVVVQPWHLALALRFAGCICPIDAIQKETITETDNQVKCTIVINKHEKVEVKFALVKS